MMIRALALAALLCPLALPLAAGRAEVLFATHCAICHGDDRLGAVGPALLPESLGRLKGAALEEVIAAGRDGTEMPGFAGQIGAADIAALATYVREPLPGMPVWGAAQITASRRGNPDYTPPEAPAHGADPLNLILVVETGDHHISVLDGDTAKVLARLPTPIAVHGAPRFSPDGRFAYVMSRDGWVQKIDLWNLTEVARIRAGVNSRNIALSDDGKWLAVANFLPNSLTLLSAADLSVAQVRPVIGKSGTPSRVSGVYPAPGRQSFVLALRDIPELWEVFYGEDPPFYGFVHDYRDEGALGYDDPFPVRQIRLKTKLEDFWISPNSEFVLGAMADGGAAVVDLVIGHTVATPDLPGRPHPGAGVTWQRGGAPVLAIPHLRAPQVSLIDPRSWEVLQTLPLDGPGFFLRQHPAAPDLWAGVFFGPQRDRLHVIDKQSLTRRKTLRPAPGQTAAHVAFDRHGRFALVSLWGAGGAIVVYDAQTLAEVARLPMAAPSGKYNVFNSLERLRAR